MTRPKVPPDQRQRTAQACESCKRRKQKCNGLCPCNTCEKRKFECIYSDRDAPSPSDDRPTKKRVLEHGEFHHSNNNGLGPGASSTANGRKSHSPQSYEPRMSTSSPSQKRHSFMASDSSFRPQYGPHKRYSLQAADEQPSMEAAARSLQQFAAGPAPEEQSTFQSTLQPHLMSRDTTQSGQDEEAVVYTQTRMLQDPTGRLLYVGDSATLSFLQLLRMMVENVAGPSTFTNDPRRHKITEGQFSLPSGTRHTQLLPDNLTAQVLIDSFFVNTHGFLQIFDRDLFLTELDRCYSDPLSTEPFWLCLLNLVFAIGLTLATPLSGSNEALIVDKLRSEHLDRAEVFYLNAKSLNDPMTGFEDADFWSIQALLLMSVYMLAKSKRNTAFALLGMAVRSAYALGLHREETLVIFNSEEQASRRNLWRSLFVVDRFLSCSLGRPTAISEDDCSGDTLRPAVPPEGPIFNQMYPPSATFGQTSASALEAAVRSCSVIGVILKRVYQQRKISTRLAQEIADICKLWPKALAPVLHWRQAATASPAQGIAILHVNLFYCHSIILLTRPFFLYVLNAETQRDVAQSTTGVRPPRSCVRMEKFSEACVIASTHTILLVQNAFEAGYLPRRNPAVIYFLFAAALVILANEFAAPHSCSPSAEHCITNAVTVMGYCAESDQQASRLFYILSTFREVVNAQRIRRKQNQQGQINLPSISSQMYGLPAPQKPVLHQVPVHVYPGMEAAGLPPPSSSSTQPYVSQIPPPSTRSPPNLTSVQQSSETATASAPSLPRAHTKTAIESRPPFQSELSAISSKSPEPRKRNVSLSNVLDLSALDAARAPSLYSEESAPDEHIDFDALWAWPSKTPAMGSPGMVEGGVQGVSDSVVPLFGVVREEGG